MSTANARFVNGEKSLLKNPAKLSSGRRSQASAPRSAPPSPTATNADRPSLRRGERPSPDGEHGDPGEHQHHDRHPGDQRHPVDRGAHLEPARREPARDDQQRGEDQQHEQVVAEVRERAGVVGQLRLLGLRRRLGPLHDVGRRRVQARSLAPCPRRTSRSAPTRRARSASRSPWPGRAASDAPRRCSSARRCRVPARSTARSGTRPAPRGTPGSAGRSSPASSHRPADTPGRRARTPRRSAAARCRCSSGCRSTTWSSAPRGSCRSCRGT